MRERRGGGFVLGQKNRWPAQKRCDRGLGLRCGGVRSVEEQQLVIFCGEM